MSDELTRRTLLAGAAANALAADAPASSTRTSTCGNTTPHFPLPKAPESPTRDAAPETLLDLMKANGVARTVIIQVIHYKYDNRYLASVLKRLPGIFQGVAASIRWTPRRPTISRASPRRASAASASARPATRRGDWFRGPLMPPLWKRCEELKVPMTVLAPITRMPEVGALLEKLPDLTVVIDHMADCPIDQPAELEKLIALKRYPKVFVKISHTWSISKQPYPWLDAQDYVKRLHAAFGPERLMWATDWPIVENVSTYERALTVVRDEMKFLNAEDKNWMMNKTIERVWPFGA